MKVSEPAVEETSASTDEQSSVVDMLKSLVQQVCTSFSHITACHYCCRVVFHELVFQSYHR